MPSGVYIFGCLSTLLSLYTQIRKKSIWGDCRRGCNTSVILLILDGNTDIGVHIRRLLWHLICLRHFLRSREVTIRIFFFSEKNPILLHACATCFELPSNICAMHLKGLRTVNKVSSLPTHKTRPQKLNAEKTAYLSYISLTLLLKWSYYLYIW